jgi:hypothetical protein
MSIRPAAPYGYAVLDLPISKPIPHFQHRSHP